jgi:hypothetical protein
MQIPPGLGYIKTAGDVEKRPLTPAEAEAVFAALAAKGDKIPFLYIKEGCEVRSQLLIEEMLTMGIDPGRAWELTVPGKTLSVANPRNPRQPIRWGNHTAPTVAVGVTAADIRIIDPSLPTVKGPLTVPEWAAAIKLTVYEVLDRPLSQAEMLARFAQGTTAGRNLEGFVYLVERGVSPVSDILGSGFRIAADPPEGIPAFVQKEVQRLFQEEAKLRSSGRP